MSTELFFHFVPLIFPLQVIYSTDVESAKENRQLTTQLLVSIGYVLFMVAGV